MAVELVAVAQHQERVAGGDLPRTHTASQKSARREDRAERAARSLGFDWAPDHALADFDWEILVHATPRGEDGARFVDPQTLTGRVVLDAVYAPGDTALVRDARARGLEAIDGLELLARQGTLQFEQMTGVQPKYETMLSAARRWLARRDA